MSNEIFDRETQLDLLVNIIPLFILGFFVVGFLVFSPFGIDPLASSIQFGLIAIPFVLLAVLTYFAAVAVAGSERSAPVYLPGQASVRGAEPIKVPGEEDAPDDTPVPDDTTAAPELDGNAAEPDSGPASGDEEEGAGGVETEDLKNDSVDAATERND